MNLKPLIIWDFDDVLFPLTEAWFKSSGLAGTGSVSTYKDITENPPHELLKLDIYEYLESLDTFRNSAEALEIKPNKVIQNWFALNGNAYQNEILTARPLHTLDAARAWLARHLPNYFQGFGFVPSPRPGVDLSGYPETKRAFLEQEGLNPQIFIDDKPGTIEDVGKMPGVRAILYPAPWNSAANKNPDPRILISEDSP